MLSHRPQPATRRAAVAVVAIAAPAAAVAVVAIVAPAAAVPTRVAPPSGREASVVPAKIEVAVLRRG